MHRKFLPYFLPILLVGCQAIPALVSGPAAKDAIHSVELEIEALESDEPSEQEKYEHEALEEAIDASIEAGESLVGLEIPVDVHFGEDAPKK